MQRVTPEQAAVFAAYDEQDAATVWYRADTRLLETESADSRNDEFIWLRDLALDHADLTAALAACEADYAEAVRAANVCMDHEDECSCGLRAILSTPRARKVLEVGR
jgi:hypothetical protein